MKTIFQSLSRYKLVNTDTGVQQQKLALGATKDAETAPRLSR